MKKKLVWSFLLLSLLLKLSAQESSLFWEIKKEGYKTSYLYGTIHINDESVFQFNDSLLPLFQSCEAFAGEIIVQPEDFSQLLPYFFEKDLEKQCQNLLNKKEYKQVSKIIQKKHGEEFLILMPMMSPYMLSVLLSTNLETSNSNQDLILDQYFQEIADSLEMDLISLESLDEQFSYIQNIDGQAQKEYLISSLKAKANEEVEWQEIIEAYLSEDLNKIQELINKSLEEDPLITEDFIAGRNLVQLNGIIEAIKVKATFTAVGAAHLPGEKGLINLLRNEGFILRPIYKD